MEDFTRGLMTTLLCIIAGLVFLPITVLMFCILVIVLACISLVSVTVCVALILLAIPLGVYDSFFRSNKDL